MFFPLVIAGMMSWWVREHWNRLGDEKSGWRPLFWRWLAQGFGLPWCLWTFFNLGVFRRMPALVPAIAQAQAHHQSWFTLFLAASIVGATFIACFWGAITYAWLAVRVIRMAEQKKDVLVLAGLISLGSGTVGAGMLYMGGIPWLGAALLVWLMPIVYATVPLAETLSARPLYSGAIARMKFGKYDEAEKEVIAQLEKCEDDFDGWMMLAELYARQFREIKNAAKVVLDICNHPASQPIQISLACHKLADWQLELEENPDGARAALQLLCRKLPGTHFARMAELRIKQLPYSAEELQELKHPKPLRLPSLSETADPSASPRMSLTRSETMAEANRLIEQLTENPNEIRPREKLAHLLAEQLNQAMAAIEQLELLIGIPETADEQKAKWLAQIAAWELQLNNSEERFQAALRRLIREYPQTSQAFAAQRRLYLLDMEKASPAVEQSAPAPLPKLRI